MAANGVYIISVDPLLRPATQVMLWDPLFSACLAQFKRLIDASQNLQNCDIVIVEPILVILACFNFISVANGHLTTNLNKKIKSGLI